MKIGVMAALFTGVSLEDTLKKISAMGVQGIELGTGNYPGESHFSLDEMLASKSKQQGVKDLLKKYKVSLTALSCHGNALHPNKDFAKKNGEVFRKTVQLAEKMGVKVVIDFSGCPGDSDDSKAPNWITCPWPPDHLETLTWQWEKKVIPYWTKAVKFAKDSGVRVALEMHPNFVVYNPETMLKLRKAVGTNIGANLDPSHLFWQGIDNMQAVRDLGKSIFHVHAKDTGVDRINVAKNGVLDTKPYTDEINRAWVFRSVGYGHGLEFWRDFASNLRMVGYDNVLSIEHEDSLLSPEEGFRRAVETLKEALIYDKPGAVWWA